MQLSDGAYTCRGAAVPFGTPLLGNCARLPLRYLVTAFSILWITAANLVAQDAAQSEAERNSLRCGPNALLAFLVLLGHSEIKASQLDAIPISSEGASLLDLRNLARAVGVDTEIRHYNVTEIDSAPLPMIVQFKNGPGAVVSNHFCVIYKVDSSYYYQIDGTTGLRQTIKKAHLEYWTGFGMSALTSAGARISWWAVLMAGFGLDVVVLAFWFRWLRSPPKRSA